MAQLNETYYIQKLNNMSCSSYNGHSCRLLYKEITNNMSIFTNYNNLFNSFISSFRKDYYGYRECSLQVEAPILFETLIDIIDFTQISKERFLIMCMQSDKFDNIIIKKLGTLTNIPANIIINIIISKNKKLIDYIFNTPNLHIELTPAVLQEMCTNPRVVKVKTQGHQAGYQRIMYEPEKQEVSNDFNNKIIMEILNHKITVTKDIINTAIISHISVETIKSLIALGPEVCSEYLEAASFSLNTEAIDFLLDNKIIPTKKCIKELFSTDISFKHICQEIQKQKPYSQKDTIVINKYKTILVKFINYNYNITYDDVLLAIEYFITIPHIEKFNIKFDSKFIQKCSDIGFYPDYNHNMKADVICLQKECMKSGNITIIRELVNKQKIMPDSVCLENACKVRSNLPVIRFLVEKGAKPSIKSLQNIIHANANSACCFVIDEFAKVFNPNNIANAQVNKKENIIEDNTEEDTESNSQENSEANEAEQIDVLGVTQLAKTQNKLEVESESEEEIIVNKKVVESESDEEELKEVKASKKYKGAKIVVKKKHKEEEVQIKPTEALIDCATIQTKITDKDKFTMPETFCKYFGIDSKIEMNLISLKKLLINHLNNKKLIKKDSFIVELSNDICEGLGLDTKKYINKLDIKELDNFCKFILENTVAKDKTEKKN